MANTTTNPFAGFLATITTQVVNHGPTRPSRDSSDHSKYLTRAHRGPYEEGFNIRYGTEEAKLDALLDDAETSKWDRCRYTRRLQTLAKELEATEDVFDNIKQGARMEEDYARKERNRERLERANEVRKANKLKRKAKVEKFKETMARKKARVE